MLDDLDKIEWNALGHAYGPAGDVPGQLRALSSTSPKTRQKAMHALYGNIWHQGTVYQATSQAVPFLIELLQSPQVADKHEILVLLAHLGKGNSYTDVHRHLPLFEKLYGEEMKTDKWKAELATELSWVEQAHQAVARGTPVYLQLLAAPEEAIRDAAAFTLGMPGKAGAEASEAIARRLAQETDPMVTSSLLLALGKLNVGNEQYESTFLTYLAQNEPKAGQLAAAISLARQDPKAVRPAVIAVLLEAIQHPEAFAALEKSQWADSQTVVEYTSRFLSGVRGNAASDAEAALIAALQTQSYPHAGRVVRALLVLVFARPINRGQRFDSLDERQQVLLKELVAARQFWGVQSGTDFIEDVDASQLMRCYNLPARHATLEAFVLGKPSQPVGPQTAVRSGGMIARIIRAIKK